MVIVLGTVELLCEQMLSLDALTSIFHEIVIELVNLSAAFSVAFSRLRWPGAPRQTFLSTWRQRGCVCACAVDSPPSRNSLDTFHITCKIKSISSFFTTPRRPVLIVLVKTFKYIPTTQLPGNFALLDYIEYLILRIDFTILVTPNCIT